MRNGGICFLRSTTTGSPVARPGRRAPSAAVPAAGRGSVQERVRGRYAPDPRDPDCHRVARRNKLLRRRAQERQGTAVRGRTATGGGGRLRDSRSRQVAPTRCLPRSGRQLVKVKKAVEGERKWAKLLWTWGCRWTGSLLGRMPDPTTIWATGAHEYTGGSTTSKPGASSRASEAERPRGTRRWERN